MSPIIPFERKKSGSALSRQSLPIRESGEPIFQFSLGGNNYVVEAIKVTEVTMVPRLIPIPVSEPFILGVINLRGNIIPVIDPSRRLEYEPAAIDKNSRLLIFEIGEMPVGFIVESVNHRLLHGYIEGASSEPTTGKSVFRRFALIADQRYPLFEPEFLLSQSEISTLQKVKEFF